MEASKEDRELRSKKRNDTTNKDEKQSRKKKKTAQPVQAESTASSDDDNVPLSQIALARKKKIDPLTPKIKDTAKASVPENTKTERTLSKPNHKVKKRLDSDDMQEKEHVFSEDNSVAAMTTIEIPHSTYESIIGQNCDAKLRIYRWWHDKMYGPRSSPSIVFLAIDDKGHKLQGSMPPYLASKSNFVVEENALYHVSALQVIQANKYNQVRDAPVQLQLTQHTRFEPLPDDYGHPQFSLILTKLSEVPSLTANQDALKDCLAVTVDIRPVVKRSSKGKEVADFAEAFLTDDSIFPKCIVLTVWREAVLNYPVFASEMTSPFILEATSVRPNKYRGNYGFQTTAFTKLTFPNTHCVQAEQMLHRIIELKEQLANHSSFQQQFSEIITESDQHIHSITEFLKEAEKKPNDNEVLLFTVKASIIHIYSELETTYRSCIMCNKGMPDEQRDMYGCPNSTCNNREGKTAQRYKLTISIKDDSGRLDMTVFNTEAEEILRTPAARISELLCQDDGLSKIQDLFRKAYNKIYKFTFRLTAANITTQNGESLHYIRWIGSQKLLKILSSCCSNRLMQTNLPVHLAKKQALRLARAHQQEALHRMFDAQLCSFCVVFSSQVNNITTTFVDNYFCLYKASRGGMKSNYETAFH